MTTKRVLTWPIEAKQVMLNRISAVISATVFFLILACRCHCAEEVLRIDLGTPTGPATFRASGFLQGISATEPPQELIEPLKPRLFRTLVHHAGLVDSPGIYERAAVLGARVHVDLSSCHGCPENGPCPGDNGDWTAWDKAVDYLIKTRKQKGYEKIEWDIWNEPNLKDYWPRSYEVYLEMWARTVRKIRSDDPTAKIIGPSICGYHREWLQRFVLWAKAEGVLPDIICWHEFDDPRGIPARVAELRGFLRANGIPLKPISLNEIVGPQHQTKPGPTAMYLWAIEQAGVDSAAHACWEDEEKGVWGCGSDSLDGLLVPTTKKPRSVWWVYRRYADLTGRLVLVEPGKSICGLASVDAKKKQIGVLIGCNAQGKIDGKLKFANLRSVGFLGEKVRVTIERIPDIGWKPLEQPEIVHQSVRVLFSNGITIPVPNIGPQDAFFVRLSPLL
jgi:xylan 1,4-beta-xylosidase